jgi:hypothetical protein
LTAFLAPYRNGAAAQGATAGAARR